jgi:predicted phosphoribosyltransferase/dienelactone hydrolase
MFEDRTEAGCALAARLAGLMRPPCVVAAIPRGGIPVALPVVRRLGVPLTVVYARKLTAPAAPDLAFGAVDEDGQETLDPAIVAELRLTREEVAAAHRRVLAEIRHRMALYGVPPVARYLPGRSVILVDDGLATGLTMQAAVGYARRHGARDITIAVPCASARAVGRLQPRVDRIVSVVTDVGFQAVGQYYRKFPAVPDQDVMSMLEQAARWAAEAAPEVSAMLDTPRGSLIITLLLPARPAPHPAVILVEEGDGAAVAEDRALAEAARCEGTAVLCVAIAPTVPGAPRGNGRRVPGADDVLAAVRWLRTRGEVDASRIALAGRGTVTAALLHAVERDPGFRALVVRSPADVPAPEAAGLAIPTLFVVGEYDQTGLRTAETVIARLAGPHHVEQVQGVNARFDEPQAFEHAARASARWLREHLGVQPDVRPATR